MPPDRGRASRACASCRKQKTRCYEPGVPGKACLRCERLRQNCSLVEIEDRETDPIAPPSGTDVRYELHSSPVPAMKSTKRLGLTK
jgi:hypothetical protein